VLSLLDKPKPIKKMFKRKKGTSINLMRDKEVVYRVSITDKSATMSSASGEWSLSFAFTTTEYGLINYLIKKDELDGLTELVRSMHATRCIFMNPRVAGVMYLYLQVAAEPSNTAPIDKFCKELYDIAKTEAENKKRLKKNEDAIVLAEEKVLREKTTESVMELEKLKKNGKSRK
jgi:hypothetical protein